MKKIFFNQLFNLKVVASVTMLFGVTFLLYACSDDNIQNPNTDATENIELGNENSMKLMVDGQFEKNIVNTNEIEDGVYKYVIINSEDDIVQAFTNEDTFKNFENYNLLKSNMPGVNGKTARILPDYDESKILAEINKQRSNAPAKTGNPNDIAHIFDYDWPDHSGGIVGHFDFDHSSYNTHFSIELKSNTQANTSLTHISYSDINNIYNSTSLGNLRFAFSNADHIVVKSTNGVYASILYLYTGTNYGGTRYVYTISGRGSVEVPSRNYNSIYVINF